MTPPRPAATEREVQLSESRTRDRLVRQSLTVSKVLCLITVLVPLLTAVGWLLGIPFLTQGHAHLPAMQPDTALGLSLGALAVFLTREGATADRRTFIALLP